MHNRFVSVHGHFYQPPRDDPFTHAMPREHDAGAFHNWNEKILAECYTPNALLGNFERMSFNIGPTLADWMRRAHPRVLDSIAAGALTPRSSCPAEAGHPVVPEKHFRTRNTGSSAFADDDDKPDFEQCPATTRSPPRPAARASLRSIIERP